MLIAVHSYNFLQADSVVESASLPPETTTTISVSPPRRQFNYVTNKTSFPHSKEAFPHIPPLFPLLSFPLALGVFVSSAGHSACLVVVGLFPPDSMSSGSTGFCLLQVPQLREEGGAPSRRLTNTTEPQTPLEYICIVPHHHHHQGRV